MVTSTAARVLVRACGRSARTARSTTSCHSRRAAGSVGSSSWISTPHGTVRPTTRANGYRDGLRQPGVTWDSDASRMGGSRVAKNPAPLLTPAQRHLVTRFGYGVDAALAQDVRREGGAQAWFEKQLTRPGAFPDGDADEVRRWWPDLDRKPADLWHRQINEVRGGWEVMADYAPLAPRAPDPHPPPGARDDDRVLGEPLPRPGQRRRRSSPGGSTTGYDPAPRARSLRPAARRDHHPPGDADLPVGNATSHQARAEREPRSGAARAAHRRRAAGTPRTTSRAPPGSSPAGGSTCGRPGPRPTSGGPLDRARVTVLGSATEPQGRRPRGHQGVPRYLAHHPDDRAPDRRAAGVKFVRDDPPQSLVERLARVYLENDTADRPVLRALVGSTEFRLGAARRCATRARTSSRPTALLGVGLDEAGQRRLGRERDALAGRRARRSPLLLAATRRPAGQQRRLVVPVADARVDEHPLVMSGGWWPTVGHRTTASPQVGAGEAPIRFDKLVDNCRQEMLHRRSTAALLEACCQATGCRAQGADHRRARGRPVGLPATARHFPRLPRPPPVTAMTDSPPLARPAAPSSLALSRRGLFRGAVALAGGPTTVAAAPAAWSAVRPPPTPRPPPVLVVLSLRGAADGLSLVVPHGDPAYYAARPRHRRTRRRQLLATDAIFGLHPALAPLLPMWNAGKLAAVHATGLPAPTAPTSPRWRRSRTPTPGRTSAPAGSTG